MTALPPEGRFYIRVVEESAAVLYKLNVDKNLDLDLMQNKLGLNCARLIWQLGSSALET